MNNEQFKKEKMYQCTMAIVRNMLKENIISEEDYSQIDTIFIKKYTPSLGNLFSDINLIKLESRVNM